MRLPYGMGKKIRKKCKFRIFEFLFEYRIRRKKRLKEKFMLGRFKAYSEQILIICHFKSIIAHFSKKVEASLQERFLELRMDRKKKLASLLNFFYYTIVSTKSDFRITFKIVLGQIRIIIHDCNWKKVNLCSSSSYPDLFKLVLDELLGSFEKVGIIENSDVYSSFNTIDQIHPINSSSETPEKDNFGDSNRFYRERKNSDFKTRENIFDGITIDNQVFQGRTIGFQILIETKER
jgi:hypothetical protein